MTLDEIYTHYGSWTTLARSLDLGTTTYQLWRKQGYIPFKSQVFIEYQSHGRFKANKSHGEPIRKPYGRPRPSSHSNAIT
jgi:hypothetical protein